MSTQPQFEEDATANAAILTAVALGLVVRWLYHVLPVGAVKWVPFPFTSVVFLLGIVLGAVVTFSSLGSELDGSVELLIDVNPSFILLVLLPPLLFASAAAVDFHVFWRVSGSALLMSFPGVVLTLAMTGVIVYPLFYEFRDAGWGWSESFMLGTILAAIDPVSVVATLSGLGASQRLVSLIEGESMLNDGSAFVFFLLFQEILADEPDTFGGTVVFFVQLAVGGPLFGLGCSLVVYIFVRIVYHDAVLEIGAVIFAVFSVFFIAEEIEVSAVLAVVVFGLAFAYRGKFALSPEVEEMHDSVWELLAFIANTLIFFISGLVIINRVIDADGIGRSAYDYWTLLVLYLALHAIRAVTVLILSPLLQRLGYGLTLKDGIMLVWSGVRGAVGLALGLLLEADPRINRNTSAVINFYVAGIVFLTLVINSPLTDFVYRRVLKMGRPSYSQQELALNALRNIESDAEAELPELKSKFFFDDVKIEWEHVQSLSIRLDQCKFEGTKIVVPHLNIHDLEHLKVFQRSGAEPSLLQGALLGMFTGEWQNIDEDVVNLRARISQGPERDNSLLQRNEVVRQMHDQGSREDLLFVFFNAVKSAYLQMFEDGFLNASAILILRGCADTAQESPACPKRIDLEWQCVRHSLFSLRRGRVTEWISHVPFIGHLQEYESTVIHIQTLAAFVRAHREAIHQHIVAGLSSFEEDIVRTCHHAQATMAHLAVARPGFVNLASTLLLTKLSVRHKRDKVLSAWRQGLLDSKTKNTLVEALDFHLGRIQDYVPRPAFFHRWQARLSLERDVERRQPATKSSSPSSGSSASATPTIVGLLPTKFKPAPAVVTRLPGGSESSSSGYREFPTSSDSTESAA